MAAGTYKVVFASSICAENEVPEKRFLSHVYFITLTRAFHRHRVCLDSALGVMSLGKKQALDAAGYGYI